MNTVSILLLATGAGALVAVPRRWAPLPFIMAACYMSISQAVDVGPFTFTPTRILIAAGVLRVICRRERLIGGLNRLDWCLILWAIWACASGAFHENPSATLVTRLGLVYNSLGIYFLLRTFCSTLEDVIGLCRATAILLIPVALEMLYEMRGSPSLFHEWAGAPLPLYIREESIRAFGPFSHPILAGTIGAVSLPLMVGLWKHARKTAGAGILACLAMIVSSASSGPVFSAAAALGGVLMWRCRHRMKHVRWAAFTALVALDLTMKAPVYYLIARVDFVQGSTGYHRALLIDSAIGHLDEWWMTGTDYTRHWAPSPGYAPQHTDITNQYLFMGVLGGLPLMLLFIAVFVAAFQRVGAALREQNSMFARDRFLLWTLGAALFGHAATFVSVTYFDQSFFFLFANLAALGSARAAAENAAERVTQQTVPLRAESAWGRSPSPAWNPNRATEGRRLDPRPFVPALGRLLEQRTPGHSTPRAPGKPAGHRMLNTHVHTPP